MARAPSSAARNPRADPNICESSRRAGSSRRFAVGPWRDRDILGSYRNVGTEAAGNRNVEPVRAERPKLLGTGLEQIDHVREDRRLVALEDAALLAEDRSEEHTSELQ